MSRLFIGPKEIQFINDLTKEYMKDITGFFAYLFPVSVEKSIVDDVYDEAIEKVFENPIKLDIIPEQPERKRTFTDFGYDRTAEFTFYVQPRDLIDKGISINPGDFVLFGSELYEVANIGSRDNIFGQAEYNATFPVTCRLARMGEIDINTFKQAIYDSKHFKDSQVQKTFEQQRGYKETEHNGATGDHRQMRERLKDDMAPIALGEGPRKVELDEDEETSSFVKDTFDIYND